MKDSGDKPTAKQVAEMASEFLKTPFGEMFIAAASLQYNGLHHEAEDQTATCEQKAFKVERAAGVKWAIDYLTQRAELLKQGDYFKND